MLERLAATVVEATEGLAAEGAVHLSEHAAQPDAGLLSSDRHECGAQGVLIREVRAGPANGYVEERRDRERAVRAVSQASGRDALGASKARRGVRSQFGCASQGKHCVHRQRQSRAALPPLL